MERVAQRSAFARACAYLNYLPQAKWAALAAGVGTGLVYIGLLTVMWLFVDLMVSRGQLPTFHDLPRADQDRFLAAWNALEPSARIEQLEAAGEKPDSARALAAKAGSWELPRTELDELWRAHTVQILREQLGIEDLGTLQSVVSEPNYDDLNRGIVGLLVRKHAADSRATGVLSLVARLNPWMWDVSPTGSHPVSAYLLGLLLIAVLLAILGAGLSIVMREMAARTVIEATTRLRRAVYHHTFRLGTLAFRALGPSEAVTVFTRHIESVHDGLYTYLTVAFREPVKFLLLLAFALFVNWQLTLAFVLFAALVWWVGGQLADYFSRRGRIATNAAGERLTIMRESLMLMRLVKVFLMEQFNQSRVERQLSKLNQVQLIRHRGEAIPQALLVFLGLLCALILLFVAGVIVLSGRLQMPGLAVMATALVSMYWPLVHYLDSRRLMKRGKDGAEQLFAFLDRRGDVGQVVGAEFLPPLAKLIEFDNVSLREPGGNRLLLEDVSLSITAGQRIGIIGSDDLEKHALIYLIPRLLDPSAGEIRMDDHNLRWVTLDSLRAQIATVLQNNLVFHDTVANNIGCGDSSFTLPQIIEAAKVAHAHHFIQKLPQGYETPIGELGHSLTTSEQYRIALARAILRDPALIIIEEPESTLDEDTKSLLDDTMARFLPGRTAIFVPHRISTIRSCDKLILLHKGRIEAAGIHKELLAQNKLYRHLHYLEFNEMAELV